MTLSVLTLVRNRTPHLVRVVEGLSRSQRVPDELVVVIMGGEDPEPALPNVSFPVRFVRLEEETALPLATARNTAARTARGEGLVFLDVDCIPSSVLVGAYGRVLEAHDGILMGQVYYLPPEAVAMDWDETALRSAGRPHPARASLQGLGETVPVDDYALFWSLSFAVRRATYRQLGGFDPSYTGYGGEDTDFAFAARAAQVPMYYLERALAFHQHHDVYDPPLHHLRSIVTNARRFREKWGAWPMEGWLRAFAQHGLVAWEPEGDRLVVAREPTADDMSWAHREAATPFR